MFSLSSKRIPACPHPLVPTNLVWGLPRCHPDECFKTLRAFATEMHTWAMAFGRRQSLLVQTVTPLLCRRFTFMCMVLSWVAWPADLSLQFRAGETAGEADPPQMQGRPSQLLWAPAEKHVCLPSPPLLPRRLPYAHRKQPSTALQPCWEAPKDLPSVPFC